jgi:hypothetical protein
MKLKISWEVIIASLASISLFGLIAGGIAFAYLLTTRAIDW